MRNPNTARLRSRTKVRRRLWLGLLPMALASVQIVGQASSPALNPTPPSAVGPAFVQWIAVSPAYDRSGLVVAVGGATACSKDCTRLWVSRDGGHTWRTAKASGFSTGRVAIAVDGSGHETLLSPGSSGLVRSDDYGDTWVATGPNGTPTVLPNFGVTHSLVVASAASSGGDYLLRDASSSPVRGSGGSGRDVDFMASPEYPNGGRFSPGLLFTEENGTNRPLVMRCSADFSCTGSAVVPGPTSDLRTSAGTTLYPASDFAEQGAVFADTPVGLAKSTDGGASFFPLTVVPANGAKETTMPMFALAPGYRESGPVRTAYVAVMQLFLSSTPGATPTPAPASSIPAKNYTTGGIYRTTDGGSTWAPLATDGPFHGGADDIAVAPDGRLFGGYFDGRGNAGLLCSIDGGSSWRASCPSVGGGAGQDAASKPGSSAQRCAGPCPSGGTGRGNTSGSVGGSQGTDLAGATPTGAANSSGTGARPFWPLVLAGIAGLTFFAALATRGWRVRRKPTDQ